ncbi:MAG: DUF3185 domain-containing protein [Acidimicrobiia bacterium]
MKPVTLVGFLLILLGVISLIFGGITYKDKETVLDVGPIEATATTKKKVPLPPVLGGLALVGGIALVIAGSRRQS